MLTSIVRFAELTQRIAKLIDELGKDSGVFVKVQKTRLTRSLMRSALLVAQRSV